jgi:hypothetical protein
MFQIELVPDLDHCIETLASKEHSKAVGQLLVSVKDKEKLYEKAERSRQRQIHSKLNMAAWSRHTIPIIGIIQVSVTGYLS